MGSRWIPVPMVIPPNGWDCRNSLAIPASKTAAGSDPLNSTGHCAELSNRVPSCAQWRGHCKRGRDVWRAITLQALAEPPVAVPRDLVLYEAIAHMEHIERVKVHLYARWRHAIEHIDDASTLLPLDDRGVPVDDKSYRLVANVGERLEIPAQIVTQRVLSNKRLGNRDVLQDPVVRPPAKNPLEIPRWPRRRKFRR